MTQYFWTAERTEILEAMAARHATMAQIAGRLGCSRNAVSGKAFRLALKLRPAPKPRRPKLPAPPKGLTPPKLVKAPMPVEERQTGAVTFREAASGQCRWGYGDPCAHDFSVCGAPVKGEGAWCHDHHAKVYPPQPKGRYRARAVKLPDAVAANG